MAKKSPSKSNSELSQVQDLKDKLARSLADYANLEKRVDSQRQLFVTMATLSIVSKMIDVLDDLYLTQKHLNDTGLKMTIDKLFNVLKTEGLEEIKADHLAFNPETMECVTTDIGPEGQVISVHKNGYTLNGQVIRPAQVTVGKQPEA